MTLNKLRTTKCLTTQIIFPQFYFQTRSKHIQDLKNEMEEAYASAEEIRNDIQQFKRRYVFVRADDTCSICQEYVMARPFHLFVCSHRYKYYLNYKLTWCFIKWYYIIYEFVSCRIQLCIYLGFTRIAWLRLYCHISEKKESAKSKNFNERLAR